jgi:tetratricopeptide (TPR) repeat protein
MKNYIFFTILCFSLLLSCSSTTNSEDFINKTTGRYLYNSNEVVEVYFEESELFLKWRGAEKIKPLKTDENSYFVKEMNEKIQFRENPADQKLYISLVPKEDTISIKYNFRKLSSEEKIPNEYLANSEFDKALESYLLIKNKDSLDPVLNENDLNSYGYKELRDKNFDKAVAIFNINVNLHPESANVYDSLGEAYTKIGDTLQAIENYEKSLSLDSGNIRAKNQLNKLKKVKQ